MQRLLPAIALIAVSFHLAGCATPQSSPASLGEVFSKETDLDVCYVLQCHDGDTKFFSRYLEETVLKKLRQSGTFFRSMTLKQSLRETKGCDVMFNYNNTGASVFSPDIGDAYSAYSGRRLFHEEKRGYSQMDNLIAALLDQFRTGTTKYAQIVAERQSVGRPEPVHEQGAHEAPPPSDTPSTPPTISDVDSPRYSASERPQDFAVVIGVERYSDLPEARFAEHDALAIQKHLYALGFPPRNVVTVLGNRVLRSTFEKYLESWLPKVVTPESSVFFYFSGHGAPDTATGEAYLVPWEGDPVFLEKTAYPLKRLYSSLGQLKAKEVIVALDSCFSGAGGRSVLAKGTRPLVVKVDTAVAPKELTVLTASSAEQVTGTLEDQGHGLFTYYFLKGLNGEAKDASGTVTAKGLYDYLKPKVQDAARRQNRDQEPVLHGSGDKELVRF